MAGSSAPAITTPARAVPWTHATDPPALTNPPHGPGFSRSSCSSYRPREAPKADRATRHPDSVGLGQARRSSGDGRGEDIAPALLKVPLGAPALRVGQIRGRSVVTGTGGPCLPDPDGGDPQADHAGSRTRTARSARVPGLAVRPGEDFGRSATTPTPGLRGPTGSRVRRRRSAGRLSPGRWPGGGLWTLDVAPASP